MAKVKRQDKTDYGALLQKLKKEGPSRLYLLWGQEEYLRESYLEEIKRSCGISNSDFNYHKLEGASFDIKALNSAIESFPFMGEKVLVEIRGFEINSYRDEKADEIKALFSDIPEYATVVLLLPSAYEPDGRLALFKAVKKLGSVIEFTAQPQTLLIKWISRRFEAMGKNIGKAECERLIFTSGDLMTGLIPEIEKIGSYAKTDTISQRDIDAVAQRIPEANVFEMTDRLSQKNFDEAAGLLAELLQSGEHPIKLLSMIGLQMRRLYTAALAKEQGLGRDFIMESCKIYYGFLADKLISSARGFTVSQLARAVELCAEADYRMKSSSEDDEEILKELFMKIAAGEG